MIFDAWDMPAGTRLEADVCIVGAGAAGITLALALADSGLEVLLLEAGGFADEEATQALYRGRVADPRLHSPLDHYRKRRFGGSTTIWGGRCVPFDDIDFTARDFVPGSGWPFGREELAPYYARANELCEAGPFAYTVAEAFERPLRPMIPGFAGRHYSANTLERFSLPTNFAARYDGRLRNARRVRVVLHANVIALESGEDGRHVRCVQVRTLRGAAFDVAARQFVLAAGGLEVPRLLLASRAVHANGMGNDHDVVGRYYMCHLAGTIGALRLRGTAWHGYDVSAEGVYCRRRLALREETQREARIGNFVARLHHPRITDAGHGNAMLSLLYLAKPLIPYEYAKRLHEDDGSGDHPGPWPHLLNVVQRPHHAFQFAWHMLIDRMLADRKFPSIIIVPRNQVFSLDFHAEQEPNPQSRVTLDRELDALGMPRLLADWRYTQGDVRTVRRALELLKEDVAATDAAQFEYEDADVEPSMVRYGAYGGHHIGTARMGSDPRRSVVDADCRVHGLDNLHVAGSAVFPTSSQANPTLTIVALALRLADRLRRLSAREVAA